MKNVLIFSLAYYPHVGGAEVAIKEITDRISSDDITFHLICNRYDARLPKVETVGNVTVYRIGFARAGTTVAETHGVLFYVVKMLFVPLAVWHALLLHRRHHFDGMWAMMLYMTFPIVLLRILGIRIPYVVTVQEGDSFAHVFRRWHIRAFLPLIRFGLRRASAVQAISSFLAGWVARMGVDAPVVVIPNGVNVSHFSQRCTPKEITETRNVYGAKKSDTVLLHVGRMVEKNGIDDIVRALAFLPPSVLFVQIGVGPEEPSLRALARTCQVADRVRFLGFVPQAELPRYLQAANIFVRPSRSEGMGNVFVEAMAAGTPVVATQEGGIADFLFDAEHNPEHEPTGWAVRRDDPKDIARAVLDVCDNGVLRKRAVANAQKMVRERFDWDTCVQDMRTRVFSRMLGG